MKDGFHKTQKKMMVEPDSEDDSDEGTLLSSPDTKGTELKKNK